MPYKDPAAWIAYKLKNRDRRNRHCRTHHMKKFGLTIAKYEEILSKQNGVCAICHQPEPANTKPDGPIRRLAVDHCHVSGKVRGLLCTNCNQGLGQFKDNADRLRAAAAYVVERS